MAKRKKKEAVETKQPVETVPAAIEAEVTTAVEQLAAVVPQMDAVADLGGDVRRRPAVDFNKPSSKAHDNVAGVRLLKFEKFQQYQLQVPQDAPAEIFQQLRDKGWTYRPDEKVYTKQYGDQGAGALYVEAHRLYQDLCQQLTPAGQAIPY